MKPSASLVLLATGAAARIHLLTRDLPQLNGILTQVLSALNETGNVILSYNGGDVTTVAAAIDKMADIARESTQHVSSVNQLSLEEAYEFQDLSKQMGVAGNQLVSDVKSKIPLFGDADACGEIETKFNAMSNAASGLMETVAARFPANAGNGDISHFSDVFTETVEMLAACAGYAGGCPVEHPPSPPSSFLAVPPSSYPTGAPMPPPHAYPPAGHPTAESSDNYPTATQTTDEPTYTTAPETGYPTATQSYGNGTGGGGGSGGSGGSGGGVSSITATATATPTPTTTQPSSPPFTGSASSLGLSAAALIAALGAFIL